MSTLLLSPNRIISSKNDNHTTLLLISLDDSKLDSVIYSSVKLLLDDTRMITLAVKIMKGHAAVCCRYGQCRDCWAMLLRSVIWFSLQALLLLL